MREIDLTVAAKTLPTIKKGVDKYIWIMDRLPKCDVSMDMGFQKIFNGFYRIRRNQEFLKGYYSYLESRKDFAPGFVDVLQYFYDGCGRIEASFSSKLAATLNPNLPVWDSIVLENLKLRKPQAYEAYRLEKTIQVYQTLQNWYLDYLKTDNARQTLLLFDRVYPHTNITDTKKIDLTLWSIR